jgi:SAM-dependent methyltransferase
VCGLFSSGVGYNKQKIMDIGAYIAGAKKEVEGVHKVWIDDLLSRLPDDAVIFEIGSATSRDADYMEKMKPSISVMRSDKERGFVEYMEGQGKKAILFDVLRDEFDTDKKYDACFAHQVVAHFTLDELESVFKKAKHALKEGGYFAFSFSQGDNVTLEEWNSKEGNVFARFHSMEEIDIIASHFGFLFAYAQESPDGKMCYVTFGLIK